MPRVATNTGNPLIDKYLVDGEVVVALVRRHWIVILEPVASAVASLLVVLVIGAYLPRNAAVVGDILFWLWFAVLARTLWLVFEWHRTWFVATDRRLLLTYGFIVRKVAMTPFRKMTDMHYSRSLMGRIIGYGRFVLESAGKDDILREINFVPHPDETYRAICGELFGKSENPARKDAKKDGGGDDASAAAQAARSARDPRALVRAWRSNRQRRELLRVTGGEDYSKPFKRPAPAPVPAILQSADAPPTLPVAVEEAPRPRTDWTTDPDEDLDPGEVAQWRAEQGFEDDDPSEDEPAIPHDGRAGAAVNRPLGEGEASYDGHQPPAVFAPSGGLTGADQVDELEFEDDEPEPQDEVLGPEEELDDQDSAEEDDTGAILLDGPAPALGENGRSLPEDSPTAAPWPEESDDGWVVSREDAARFTPVAPTPRRPQR